MVDVLKNLTNYLMQDYKECQSMKKGNILTDKKIDFE